MANFGLEHAKKVFAKLEVHGDENNCHLSGFLLDKVTGRRLFPPLFFNDAIDDRILEKFRNALKLFPEEFEQLMSCTMTRDIYFDIRRERG